MASPASPSHFLPSDFSALKQKLMQNDKNEQEHQKQIQMITKFYEKELETLKVSLDEQKLREQDAKKSLEEIRQQFQEKEKEMNDSHEKEVMNFCRRIVKLERNKNNALNRASKLRKELSDLRVREAEHNEKILKLEDEVYQLRGSLLQQQVLFVHSHQTPPVYLHPARFPQ
ncbi:hypothetical protein DMENIID0001_014200 [Sergentomyia squamirostris]